MTPTESFVQNLISLKPGELGMLRRHVTRRLDESVDGFDLFAGLWWPLREKNQRAPRREVAWLIAKLYAAYPLPQREGATLAKVLGGIQPHDEARRRRFDELLSLSLPELEPALRWALALVGAADGAMDWVRLTDQLSIWEREETRLKWANEYLHLF